MKCNAEGVGVCGARCAGGRAEEGWSCQAPGGHGRCSWGRPLLCALMFAALSASEADGAPFAALGRIKGKLSQSGVYDLGASRPRGVPQGMQMAAARREKLLDEEEEVTGLDAAISAARSVAEKVRSDEFLAPAAVSAALPLPSGLTGHISSSQT